MTTVTGTPAAEELRADRVALGRAVDTAAVQVRDAADRLVPTGQFRDELHAVVSGRVRPYLAALAATLHRVARADERTAPLVDLLDAQHERLALLTEELTTTRTAATSVAAAAAVRTQVAAVLGGYDVLVPAAQTGGVDLAAVSSTMLDLLQVPGDPAGEQGGCGCGGCGCGAGEPEQGPRAAGEGDLDVREIPRSVRHERIFAAVDALEPRESLVLAVDHDPVPLREQIERREPGQVVWEYLAEGPELWRVRLSRVPGHCC